MGSLCGEDYDKTNVWAYQTGHELDHISFKFSANYFYIIFNIKRHLLYLNYRVFTAVNTVLNIK